ncbi:hypothetical protein I305_00423 [Cryptococcus gattii E566]|nr:hypothetical protein I305_00423 [Cryptococcus gattii E566]
MSLQEFNVGPSPCYALVITMRESKTNHHGILFFARYAFRVQHHPERLSGCVAPVLAKHAEEEILI